MWIKESLDTLTRHMNGAVDHRAAITFMEMIYLINIAYAETAQKWAQHTAAVIAYVYAGNYAGTTIGAKRILNAVARKEKSKRVAPDMQQSAS